MTASGSTFAAARVADVMHGPAIECGPLTPIEVVAQTMADNRVHAVIVTGIERTAWSVITALDVAAAAARGAAGDVARDVAGSPPLTVPADMPLTEAAQTMVDHRVDHLIVGGADGRPVGVVATSDVVRAFAAPA